MNLVFFIYFFGYLIKLYFLPANTTSKLQPQDAGIISSFKSEYHKNLSQKYVLNAENYISIDEYIKSLNVIDAIEMIVSSWQNVTEKPIKNCWLHCGYQNAV